MSSLKRVNKQGFTVIEIMCVLIIISIVSSIALPAINNFHSSDRCKAEASVFVSYIRQAKYQAMQDNRLKRLIFSPENEGDTGNVFKVQTLYAGEVEDVYSDTEQSFIIYPDPVITGDDSNYTLDYDSSNWVTIADTEEIEINSSVEVDLASLTLPINDNNDIAIYFKPDGFLYDSQNQKISEQRIVFRYGSSAVAVDVNALGVISSEAIPNEEDDFFDDKHDETKDEDDSGYNPPE